MEQREHAVVMQGGVRSGTAADDGDTRACDYISDEVRVAARAKHVEAAADTLLHLGRQRRQAHAKRSRCPRPSRNCEAGVAG